MDTEKAEHPDYLPFLALEAATLIAGTGNGVAAIALPWLTLRLTNDPAAAGIVVAVGAVPTLFTSLASGVIIDRLGRKRTSVGSDVFSAVSAAMIPVAGLLGALTYPLVLVASVIGAMFDPVGVTAREALLPDVARRAKLQLERVNGVHEAVWGLAWLIGPGVAGLLIGAVGAADAFWVMCVGFIASAAFVGAARMPTVPRLHSESRLFADALEGFRFVWGEPAIRSTTVLSTISFTFLYSLVAVVLPVIFERLDRPEQLGLLFVAFSAGGIAGALLYSSVGTSLPRRATFAAGMFAVAVMAAVFALTSSYAIQITVMVLTGFVSGPVSPIANVVLQERTAEEIRGRALSIAFAFAYALFPLGYVAAGFMVKALGVTPTFAAFAAGSAVVAVWSMFTPALTGIGPPDTLPDA